jgi:hypothetical protein
MSFQAFQQSIVSPDLQAIAAHWGDARGTKRMPAFRDIDPVAIGRRLRYVWAWKYVREPDDFINRLAGDRNFSGESIMLPLSEDGETSDGILGATIYLASAGVGAATSFETEKLAFYPLD